MTKIIYTKKLFLQIYLKTFFLKMVPLTVNKSYGLAIN